MHMVEEFSHACLLQRKGRFQVPLHDHSTARWEASPMGCVKVGSSVLPSIFEIMDQPWELRFSFVRREGNVVTDVVARLLHPESLDYQRWLKPLLVVRDVLLADEGHVAHTDTTDSSCVRFPLQRAMMTLGFYSCMGVILF
ncbi:hypothetical protein V6N12_067870 [Hibiscus sabdariffa]|uniref:RNase H type-1 domain-containing protein n=1 Tax=Hibiscus sabdariffa TaxID=183260 RepID=A0ABR2FND3_9ROSI